MIKFEIDNKTVMIERESIEARLQEAIVSRLDESKEVAPMMRSVLKMGADLIIPMLDVKPPKGEDKLAFLTSYMMKLAFDAMEGAVMKVDGRIDDPADKRAGALPFEPTVEEVNADAD